MLPHDVPVSTLGCHPMSCSFALNYSFVTLENPQTTCDKKYAYVNTQHGPCPTVCNNVCNVRVTVNRSDLRTIQKMILDHAVSFTDELGPVVRDHLTYQNEVFWARYRSVKGSNPLTIPIGNYECHIRTSCLRRLRQCLLRWKSRLGLSSSTTNKYEVKLSHIPARTWQWANLCIRVVAPSLNPKLKNIHL